jgi:CBS domain-containing protein
MTSRVPRGASPAHPFEQLTVADVMRGGVLTCHPNASLQTVARTMSTHNVHSVVVAGITRGFLHGERLAWGLLSDMDLVRAVPSGVEGHLASEVARTEAVGVDPTTPLVAAAGLMAKHDTAHVVVVDAGEPIGIVSTLDIINALALNRR